MSFEKYLAGKKALVITLDDALYPKKDYLLQVFYLFSEFMAYSEQIDAKSVLDFMRREYERNGEENLFTKTAAQFGISEKYEHNFLLLFETARLPLKLLLFQQVLSLLQEAVLERMPIFIWVSEKPAIGLNKIKQMEWNGLEPYLKVYFVDEFGGSVEDTLSSILQEQSLEGKELVMFSAAEEKLDKFAEQKIDTYSVTEIL